MSIERPVEDKTIHKAVERQLTERVKLMGDVELLRALQNAQNSYKLLIQQDQERGKKTNSTPKPSEQKEQKIKLLEIIDAIQKEYKDRQAIRK
jgi:hypothetical protein